MHDLNAEVCSIARVHRDGVDKGSPSMRNDSIELDFKLVARRVLGSAMKVRKTIRTLVRPVYDYGQVLIGSNSGLFTVHVVHPSLGH